MVKPISKCKTETHRVIIKTKHGVINKDVRIPRENTPGGELTQKAQRKPERA